MIKTFKSLNPILSGTGYLIDNFDVHELNDLRLNPILSGTGYLITIA